jgi:hypothetical protein
MINKILTACIVFTAISCKQSTTLTENEKATIIKDVRTSLDGYFSDIKKSGLSAEYKHFDNSPDFFWVPPGYSDAISYESFATILKENAPNSKSIDNSIVSLRIIPLSKELASYYARINSTMIDTTGKAETYDLIESGIWIKRQDRWKLLSGQTAVLNSK